MSPSENKPEAPIPVPEADAEAKPSLAPGASSETQSIPPTKPSLAANKTTKPRKLSQKSKITLLIAGWILLLGVVAGVALLIKPAPEIIHTDSITEAYKFSATSTGKVTDTVDDLDYYGHYQPNPLTFTRIDNGNAKGAYTISGLKNKSIEERINRRIREAASALYDLAPERDFVSMDVFANYFNVLSIRLGQYAGVSWLEEYHTFDLNTGDELSFDDLFSENADLVPLMYNSFYNGLSSDIQFAKLYDEKVLRSENYAPDPADCIMYCPGDGETYDDVRAHLAEYDQQLANIEQTAVNAIRHYLDGERKFYLLAGGPVFVLDNDSKMTMELKDNIRYAVYLKHYRSKESLYENEPSTESNPFFTETPGLYANYFVEETDTYLFDYAERLSSDGAITPAIRRGFREHIKDKGLAVSGSDGKFRHILATGNAHNGSIRSGYAEVCVYETDKSYYDATYKKAIIDGKLQSAWMSLQQPARIGRYNEERVTQLSGDDSSSDCTQFYAAITSSGTPIENVDGILINPSDPNLVGWEEYLQAMAYSGVCYRSWDQKCYTEEERQLHQFIYEYSGGSGITIKLKENSTTDPSYFYHIDFANLPRGYINPEIIVE